MQKATGMTSSKKKPRNMVPEKAREHYDDIPRDNALFTDYYTRQELVPLAEWPLLMETLGKSLPLTFRLTGHRAEACTLLNQLTFQLLPALGTAARPLEWYRPAGYAFHLDTDRKSMRTAPEFAEFHSWLVSATENGDISRQEAVSMIPPLFLDIQSDHLVLDMCAAPGSKTAQLVEYLHAAAGDESPTGLVIANDSDQQRAYMLYHQVKRILSPSLLVTNNDGTTFPTLIQKTREGSVERVLFDRILADVPCSGDGTLRKNATLWKTWTPNQALGLHPLQVRLLEKAVRLLKVGGRVVYSTCSMNFFENEAVVAHVLDKYRHALELVDVSGESVELIRRPGRHVWKVVAKEDEEYQSFQDVPEKLRKRFPASLFPKESYADLQLDRSLRIYPHLQNTGGFYVAVIHKRAHLNANSHPESAIEGADGNENGKVEKAPRPVFKKGTPRFGVSAKAEGEFRHLDVATDPVLRNIFDWYGMDLERMTKAGYGFLVRSERNPVKVISVVSARTAPILAATVRSHRGDTAVPEVEGGNGEENGGEKGDNERLFNQSLKIVNAGVRAFEIYESSRPVPVGCSYRPLAESVAVLRPFMTKRVSQVECSVAIKLLTSQDSVKMDLGESIGQGGAVLETRLADGNVVLLPVWISERGIKAFVPNANRPALLLQLNGGNRVSVVNDEAI